MSRKGTGGKERSRKGARGKEMSREGSRRKGAGGGGTTAAALTFTTGTKCSMMWASGSCRPILHSDSAALSRTTVSSTDASDSRGCSNVKACWLPPTNCTKLPSSSAMARRTSSSSSLFSFRNGMSSLRVRSSPSAHAIVLRRLMLLSRSATSSFFSSSLQQQRHHQNRQSGIPSCLRDSVDPHNPNSAACAIGCRGCP